MTSLGKAIITCGISIFTLGTLTWIVTGDWHWFAGGGTLFVSSLGAAIVLSAETKQTGNGHLPRTIVHDGYREPETKRDLRAVHDDWTPPPTPPPDVEDTDPFFKKTT